MPKVTDLAAASLPLAGTETVYVVQGGNSRKSDVNAIADVALAGVPAEFNATGAAPLFACRAWVNFNGTGTVAIRASGNVASITDNGVGDYTINFTTAMPDANYAWFGCVNDQNSGYAEVVKSVSLTASSIRIVIRAVDPGLSTAVDCTTITVAIFR